MPRSKGKSVIGTKWVYQNKLDEDVVMKEDSLMHQEKEIIDIRVISILHPLTLVVFAIWSPTLNYSKVHPITYEFQSDCTRLTNFRQKLTVNIEDIKFEFRN